MSTGMFPEVAAEIRTWFEALIGALPGKIGCGIRRTWYSNRFRSGGKLTIEPFCEFIATDSIVFRGDASIGRNCFFTADGGFIEIGDQTSFNTNVHVNASMGGRVKIGDNCLIGPNVVLRTANHRYEDNSRPIRDQGHVSGEIVIEDDVWIGANVVIVKGVKIESGAVIGAGAVVTKNVPRMAIVVGQAAETIRTRGTASQASD